MNNRIDMVDALRGYALLGLFLVHCVERFELHWLDPQPGFWFDAVFAVFSGKAFAIFALLFGFSFATIMANERGRGGDYTMRFAWRLVLLFAIGTLHALVYRGDILQVLAAVGLLMIPFDRVRRDWVLLVLALLLFLQIPLLYRAWAAVSGVDWAAANPLFWGDSGLGVLAHGSFAELLVVNAGPGMTGKWSFYLEIGRVVEIAGLFLVGMVIQRRSWFADAKASSGVWHGVFVASGLLWISVGLLEPLFVPQEGAPVMQRQSLQWAADEWRALGATGFQVAIFALLWITPFRRLLSWFAPPGRMTLTLYVGQSLLAVPLLYGFGMGWRDDFSHGEMVAAGILAFALQALAAAWWFRHFRYGPLEWLWRVGTRTSWAVPFRRAAA